MNLPVIVCMPHASRELHPVFLLLVGIGSLKLHIRICIHTNGLINRIFTRTCALYMYNVHVYA